MTPRGFPTSEYKTRLAKAQREMAANNLSALLLTTEPEVRYFTGFLTRFWESPSRPWFLVVPVSGDPIAVIPSIGAALMAQTWIADIRTWVAPNLLDDGISLLSDCLKEIAPGGRVGIPSGMESHLRMPLADYHKLRGGLTNVTLCDDANIVRGLRSVKSELEIAKITHACQIAGNAFARLPEIANAGNIQSKICRDFQSLLLDEGADNVPYLSTGLGPSGYGDVISPPSNNPIQNGDILMLDTGLVWDGYFADFDRNYSVGKASQAAKDGFAKLQDAVDAGLAAATVGATTADIFFAMSKITGGGKAAEAGRVGHGLGMQLTEWPSLIAADQTILEHGMVLTLEPSIEISDGRILVHEENIVVQNTGARMISPRAPQTMVEL